MRMRNPEESHDESAPDVCPVPRCGRELTDDGECEIHGNEGDWRKLSEESRADFRANYEDR